MSRLTKYITQRYPLEENIWKIIIPISLFVGLFMLIFQPFGLDELQSSNKYLILSGYGLVTFLVLLFNMWLLPSIFPAGFREENWTVLKEILFLLWILFTVGLANLLYSSWTMGFTLVITNILIFQAYTLAVGLIPITALTLVKQNYLNRKNRETAHLINAFLPDHPLQQASGNDFYFASDSGREELNVSPNNLLFIKSEGNYITIGFLQDGKFKTVLLRNTMKYAEEILQGHPGFFRCHRSWIVNTKKISRISGNSQGLRISLPGFEEEIPVARNLVGGFRRILEQGAS